MVFDVTWECPIPHGYTEIIQMNDYIGDHKWDPLGVFSMMSHIGIQGFLVQSWIKFSPRGWSLDTDRFFEEGIVGVWHKKKKFSCFSMGQNNSHGQVQLEAFIIADVGDKIQCLKYIVTPPSLV